MKQATIKTTKVYPNSYHTITHPCGKTERIYNHANAYNRLKYLNTKFYK